MSMSLEYCARAGPHAKAAANSRQATSRWNQGRVMGLPSSFRGLRTARVARVGLQHAQRDALVDGDLGARAGVLHLGADVPLAVGAQRIAGSRRAARRVEA